jgi:putative GTP pyrophosphokinase
MDRATPEYSRKKVNRAGDTLLSETSSPMDKAKARVVLGNWRACHAYPINTFQATLRGKLNTIDPNAIVAQRLKRTPSILAKLSRFQGMRLARMQDIGGLRAVVATVEDAKTLEQNYKGSRFKHELVSVKDYINAPKPTGYRGVHLVYRYRNPQAPEYDGLLLELQIRTRLQHAWATAVETMGTFINCSLKSSEGPERWLGFFAASGSAFAVLEGCPPVDAYSNQTREEIFETVLREAEELDVYTSLEAFSVALDAISEQKSKSSFYHLITLDPIEKKVFIASYGRRKLDEASQAYIREEARIAKGENIQVVLVSAGPIEALKRAYPNYFLDTREFISTLREMQHQLSLIKNPLNLGFDPKQYAPTADIQIISSLAQGIIRTNDNANIYLVVNPDEQTLIDTPASWQTGHRVHLVKDGKRLRMVNTSIRPNEEIWVHPSIEA